MPSYRVTFLTENKIEVWIPEGQSDGQKAGLAMDHIALATFAGQSSKLLSIEPTPVEGWVPPDLTPGVSKIK